MQKARFLFLSLGVLGVLCVILWCFFSFGCGSAALRLRALARWSLGRTKPCWAAATSEHSNRKSIEPSTIVKAMLKQTAYPVFRGILALRARPSAQARRALI